MRAIIDGIAQYVKHPAQRLRTDWNADRAAGVYDREPPLKTCGASHGDPAHRVRSDVLLDLYDEAFFFPHPNVQRVVDAGQIPRWELGIHNHTRHPGYCSDSCGHPHAFRLTSKAT